MNLGRLLLGAIALLTLSAVIACGGTEIREVEVVKIVEKEVPIEVIKEIEVEKIVKQVETVLVTETIIEEVEVEVAGETVTKIVEKEVVKEVIVAVATPVVIHMDASLQGHMMKSSDDNPKRGGVVRTAGPVEMAHWDLGQGAPAYTGITNVYNNLTYRNLEKGLRGVVPDLATGWSTSADGLTYTFTLRENAKWHDGVGFSGADVMATFDRILNPTEGVNTAQLQQSFEAVEDIKLVDLYTVEFTLKRPTPWFIEVLGAAPHFGYPVIYPKHFLDLHDQNVRENLPPGTGAFKYKDRIPGEYLEMEANVDYWNPDLPYVDGIKAMHIPVWANRGAAVLTSIVDFTWNGNQETWGLAMEEPDKFHGSNPPINGVSPLWINNEKAPFDDPRVRRAIQCGIDKDYARGVAGSIALPNYQARWLSQANPYAQSDAEIIQEECWRTDEAGRAADIKIAKDLLAEAGYADGFHIEAVGNNTPAGGEVYGVAMLQQMEEILGITSDIEIIERGVEGEALVDGQWHIIFATGIGSDVPDPTAQWNKIYRCDSPSNYYRYCNPEFDKQIIDRLLVEFDPAVRAQIFEQAADMLDANPPGIMISGGSGLPMGHVGVKGISIDNLGGYPWGRYETVWLDR